MRNKQVAQHLNISIDTVNNHRRNTLEKAGARNSSELLSYALKQGLLQ
jgi:DNA-binding CsgD family transcriptional regulator